MGPEIKRLQEKYNLTSKVYDILDFYFEYSRYRRLRKILWKFAKGKILDAGVGTGRNFDFYPVDGEVIGIDIGEGMLVKAKKRAEKKNIKVDLRQMSVLDMSFPNNYFDTIVATFLFCVLPDSLQVPALQEVRRVCKKDGEIILLEYTLSKNKFRRRWMKIISHYVQLLYGASFDRKTSEYLRKENFQVIEEKFLLDDVIKIIRVKV